MAKHVSPNKSGRTPSSSKKSRGIKKYAVDIQFPTGQRRCAGVYMHGSSAIKKWRELIATCSLADQVLITNRHMNIHMKGRGRIGHC